MSNTATDDPAQQFGIDAVSDGVQRLTELVKNQEASTAAIAKIISQDQELTARVLRAANPRADDERDYTITDVDAALMRCGVGGALMVAMTGPLLGAVRKTFETMLALPLETAPARSLEQFVDEHVIAEVAFAGKAEGAVEIRLSHETARVLSAAMLGLTADDLGAESEVNDVLGELANIVVGNFKSNLCDAGLTCKLSPPKITATKNFKLRAQDGGLAERMGFRSGAHSFFIDIGVNPWS